MIRWYTREPDLDNGDFACRIKPVWHNFRVEALIKDARDPGQEDRPWRYLYNSKLSEYNARYVISWNGDPLTDQFLEFESESDLTYFLLRFG